MDTENSRKRRRRYDAALKAQIVAECGQPGASVANVAMAHGINANIVHGWRKLARKAGATGAPVRFVPVTVAAACREPADERSIKLELRRGSITIKLSWPMSAAMDLSAWMRELLR
jgi:transposase